MDQASTLRDLVNRKSDELTDDTFNSSNVFLITSGKGGVGKTILSVNLAASMGTDEKPTLLIEGDIRGGHHATMLGINPAYNLQNVVAGEIDLPDAIDKSFPGVHLLSGADDFSSRGNYNFRLIRLLTDNIERLSAEYRTVIIDAGASNPDDTANFCKISTSCLCLTTPDVTSITDTYALIKFLFQNHNCENMEILINMAGSEEQADDIVRRINLMTQHFLSLSVPYTGFIKTNSLLHESVEIQYPGVLAENGQKIKQAFEKLGNNLISGERKQVIFNEHDPVDDSVELIATES